MTSTSLPLLGHRRRTAVAIDVTVHSVLERVEARIVNLSEQGARLSGASLPERSRCQIHYRGQTVYAIVMWAEVDRMGVRFPYDLTDGPLHEALEAARRWTYGSDVAAAHAPTARAGFGRRGLH